MTRRRARRRYLVRIDQPERSTHGWQARTGGRWKRPARRSRRGSHLVGYRSQFFADGKYGGPEAALAEAGYWLYG